ncbi:tetratricopeptide repeat protein [Histomonas meleagridis]|uniref:tetratricopeptide repeat protein n=1 Tax=Histomonas meleagridis TaxID=135588 RepID=UPI0035595061|nr:tetratricopeptide repeat protein [Histomonas meleagridis]KAH0805895.1 tetratricopeptide repeat protein [Histomonas meleagridis]
MESRTIEFDPSTVNPNELLETLVTKKHIIGVVTALEAYHNDIKKSTLFSVLVYLAKNSNYAHLVSRYVTPISKSYPAQVASIRAFILIHRCPPDQVMVRCSEALKILEKARKKDKRNPQLLENIAYLHAKMHDKEKSLEYLKRNLTWNSDSNHSRLQLLLMIRIFRSNCQFDEALTLANSSYDILGRYDKFILIEGMFCSAENGDMTQMESFFHKLKKLFKADAHIMSATTRLNIMLGKLQNASECFQSWGELESNQQSADFFFCYSQLCLALKEHQEAARYLAYAVEMDPCNVQYMAALATTLYKLGTKEKANEIAKRATAVDPWCFHAWLALATVCEDKIEAEEALKKAIVLRRKSVDLTSIKMRLN